MIWKTGIYRWGVVVNPTGFPNLYIIWGAGTALFISLRLTYHKWYKWGWQYGPRSA